MTDRVNLYTLLHDLGSEYDYIAMGDTDHRDEIVRDFRGDLTLFAAAKSAGYTAFTLEKPPEDLLYNQVISTILEADPDLNPEQYYNELAESGSDPVGIVGAFAENAYDMTAIYPDPRYSPEFNLALMNVYGVIEQASEECADVFLQAHWKSDPETAEFFESEVFKGDDIIAERIQEQSGGRAFIIYGNGHFTGQNDLNEMLGTQNVAHIAAIASREAGYNPSSTDRDNPAPDYPDYIYVIDEDAIVPFDLDNPEIQQILENFTSFNVPNLDQETFDNCTEQLPDSLEPHAVTQEEYEQWKTPVPQPGIEP
ncbi:MAG: hypothetical protein ACLFR0_09275 [Alphaproteobacteria bacterium]